MIKALFLKSLLWILEFPSKIRIKIKKLLIVESLQAVGSNFLFDPIDSVFPSTGKMQVGDNVFIGKNAWFGGEIFIGNNVMFGPNVTLLAANHIFAIKGKSPRFLIPISGQNNEPIIIENEVWIGANVAVLGNVTIGIGAVVGAGSVVASNVCPFTVSVGNPCRPVRRVFDDENLLLHLLEIGYNASFSAEVVDRRNKFLKNIVIPVVDKTDIFKEYTYESV